MTHRIQDPSFIPDLLLERYRLGEMSLAESEQFQRRLEADEELRGRLGVLAGSDKEIQQRYSSSWLALQVRQRLHMKRPGPVPFFSHGRRRWQLPLAAAALALLALGIGWQLLDPQWPPFGWKSPDSIEPMDRIKGYKLVLFRKTAGGSEVLADGDRVHAGDQIRIGYRAAGRVYGLILSLDGRGVVTRHFPQQGDQAAALVRDGLVLLDQAYELDDAPGGERFYLVCGQEAFDIGPVLEAARKLAERTPTKIPGALVLSTTLDQSSLILMKEVTR